MSIIKSVYRRLLPFGFRMCIRELRIKFHFIPSENRRLQRIKSGAWMDTHKEECKYMLKNGKAVVFPYSWTEEYRTNAINVYSDMEKHMSYVMVNGKRMYFPRSFSKEEAKVYFNRAGFAKPTLLF